jgi:hypothetical protein
MAPMSTLQLLLLSSLLALALGMWLARKLDRLRARRVGRAHNLRGRRGELLAEKLLEQRGYRLVSRQLRGSYRAQLGEELVEVSLQADFLVERDGRQFVVEVKTGRNAPRFEHPETRRQLLEYQLGFGLGVLLVDVENQELREVSFPIGTERAPAHPGGWLLALLACLAGLSWLAIRLGGQ